MKIHYHPHQMYSPDQDDTSTKLKTSKEELEAGKAVVDAQFGDLFGIVIGIWESGICIQAHIYRYWYWYLAFVSK